MKKKTQVYQLNSKLFKWAVQGKFNCSSTLKTEAVESLKLDLKEQTFHLINYSLNTKIRRCGLIAKCFCLFGLFFRFFAQRKIFYLIFLFTESQTEISAIEQELKRAQDNKQEIERKIKLIEEEKNALEKVICNLEKILLV